MKIRSIPSGPLMVNSYLVYDEVNKIGFIVDPGGFKKKMMEIIKENGLDIRYIILTHGHGDHIGGVERYREEIPGIVLVAAKAEVPLLADPEMNISSMIGQAVSLVPDMTVEEGDELDIGDMRLRFVMTPGHTPGSMCVIMDGEGAVFSGDTLFSQSIGRTDFPGGSLEQLIGSIRKKLLVLPDETEVYPGHMGATTIGFERKYNPFV